MLTFYFVQVVIKNALISEKVVISKVLIHLLIKVNRNVLFISITLFFYIFIL